MKLRNKKRQLQLHAHSKRVRKAQENRSREYLLHKHKVVKLDQQVEIDRNNRQIVLKGILVEAVRRAEQVQDQAIVALTVIVHKAAHQRVQELEEMQAELVHKVVQGQDLLEMLVNLLRDRIAVDKTVQLLAQVLLVRLNHASRRHVLQDQMIAADLIKEKIQIDVLKTVVLAGILEITAIKRVVVDSKINHHAKK